jgi:hypothetical protein
MRTFGGEKRVRPVHQFEPDEFEGLDCSRCNLPRANPVHGPARAWRWDDVDDALSPNLLGDVVGREDPPDGMAVTQR